MRRVLLVASLALGTLGVSTMATSCSNDAFTTAGAEDASLEGAPPDGPSADGGAGCAPGTKSCIVCVAAQSPASGCNPLSCESCRVGAHAEAGCLGTTCGIGACQVPYVDCDNNAANGCEVNPHSGDPTNCGACGITCLPGLLCQLDGGCASSCGGAGTACDGGCVNTTNDPKNCSGCGKVCPGLGKPNGTVDCVSGACTLTCATGFSNCNQNTVDGCECDLTTSVCNGTQCQPCAALSSSCAGVPCCANALGQPTCGAGSVCCMHDGDPCGTNLQCCSGTCRSGVCAALN